MELIADVHVKTAYLTALRSEGYDIERVVDIEALGGTASDDEILAYAAENNRIVLTNDAKDFDRDNGHSGVIIVPQSGLTPGEVAAAVIRIDRLLTDLSDTVLYATDWV